MSFAYYAGRLCILSAATNIDYFERVTCPTENVYLDYNVFAYYHDNKNPRVRVRIDKLRAACKFCYSSAHLEGIGSSLMWAREQNKAQAKKIAK